MIKIGDRYFNLKINRKNNRNIYLRVKGDTLEISCPRWVRKDEIISFIMSKEDWINKTIESSNIKRLGSKLGIGDTIYYLGKEYPLTVVKGREDFKVLDGRIIIYCKSGEMEDAIKTFYKLNKKKILDLINAKQDRYLNILEDYGYNLLPDYKMKLLKSAWGINYSKKNLVVINERLIHFDERCLEAILWHELLHFIIPNHSKRFYEILTYYMADYKELVKSIY